MRLAAMLRRNGSLTELALPSNGLGPVGAALLAEALRGAKHCCLARLDLTRNAVGARGAEAFAAGRIPRRTQGERPLDVRLGEVAVDPYRSSVVTPASSLLTTESRRAPLPAPLPWQAIKVYRGFAGPWDMLAEHFYEVAGAGAPLPAAAMPAGEPGSAKALRFALLTEHYGEEQLRQLADGGNVTHHGIADLEVLRAKLMNYFVALLF